MTQPHPHAFPGLTTNEALAVLTSYHLSDADLRNLMMIGPQRLVTESPKFSPERYASVLRSASQHKAIILPTRHPIRARAAGLWKVGTLTHNRRVSFITSSEASAKHNELAATLARTCALVGVDVIADLASEADAAIHRAVLKARGNPIAVLSRSVADIDAELAPTARRIVQTTGALVSAYAPGLEIEPDFIVERAQTAASLSQLVVITSAATLSSAPGGAARRAKALGVPIAAVPGSLGCDTMIAGGMAHRVADRDDMLALLRKLYG